MMPPRRQVTGPNGSHAHHTMARRTCKAQVQMMRASSLTNTLHACVRIVLVFSLFTDRKTSCSAGSGLALLC
jgi:uncharacterized membrane protein